MSDRERQRLADIQAAIDAIRSPLQRGDLTDGLVSDAVRIRLLKIGSKPWPGRWRIRARTHPPTQPDRASRIRQRLSRTLLPIRSASPRASGLTGAVHSGSPTLLWVCGVTPTGVPGARGVSRPVMALPASVRGCAGLAEMHPGPRTEVPVRGRISSSRQRGGPGDRRSGRCPRAARSGTPPATQPGRAPRGTATVPPCGAVRAGGTHRTDHQAI